MKIKKLTTILFTISGLIIFSIGIKIGVHFSIINIEKLKFLPDIVNVTERGYLDEVWDFEKVIKPDKSGYYNWVVGSKAEDISAARIASGTTVTLIGKKELNMDYRSMEDYNKRNGHDIFIKFIESYKD